MAFVIPKTLPQLEDDTKKAKDFLSVIRRRNGVEPATASTPAQRPLIPDQPKVVQGEYGANRKAVLKAITICPVEYTINDVEKALIESGVEITRTGISQALNRLSRKKEIIVLRQGAGRKATVFKK